MGKYFTIAELCASDTARERGIDNTPPPVVKVSLETLISQCLDPIREAWGKPIRVNSGFRCPVLNRDVGGSVSSQHTRGEAADITAGDEKKNAKLLRMIIDRGFEFDQLIDERGCRWLHISYAAGRNRRQFLRL